MAGLDRFEQFFERMVEGTIMRVFRSPIQPAEIGRKLERAMEDGRIATPTVPLVPNRYHVAMHPQDMIVFADFVVPLSKQMAGWLAEEIANRGYQTLGQVAVQITGSDQVSRRTIKVTATATDEPAPSSSDSDRIQRTELIRVMQEQGSGVPPQILRLLNANEAGRTFTISGKVTTIGRGLDNDLVLDSTDVSRHHAKIEYRDGQWYLVDLGSTNGSKLNGQTIHHALLQSGDRLELGGIPLEFSPYVADPNAAAMRGIQ